MKQPHDVSAGKEGSDARTVLIAISEAFWRTYSETSLLVRYVSEARGTRLGILLRGAHNTCNRPLMGRSSFHKRNHLHLRNKYRFRKADQLLQILQLVTV